VHKLLKRKGDSIVKAFVTGGAGFIGSHLTDSLLDMGTEVHIIDNLSSGKKEYVNPAAVFHELDISDPSIVELIDLHKPDYIYHLAAQADVNRSTECPYQDMKTNLIGTINLLDGCRKAPIKKFIFSSTSAVYGNGPDKKLTEQSPLNPASFYGLSKVSAEKYIQLYGDFFSVPFSILRYGNVYGPRQTAKGEGGVIAIFLEKLKQSERLKVNGDGDQTRDFIYVQDIVDANIAASMHHSNDIFHISTGSSASINKLIELLNELHPSPIDYFHSENRIGDIKHSCLDNSKAVNSLNWSPSFSLKEGILQTYRSFLKK
jgi:UDP-glucose 4-epimerase